MARPMGGARRSIFQAVRQGITSRDQSAVGLSIGYGFVALAADRRLPARQVDNNRKTTTTVTQQQFLASPHT